MDRKPSDLLEAWARRSALALQNHGIEIQLSSSSGHEWDESRGITLTLSEREADVRLHPSGDCDVEIYNLNLCALSFGQDSLEFVAVIEYHRLTSESELEDIFAYILDYILADEQFSPPSIDELHSWLDVNRQMLEEAYIEADSTTDDTYHAWFSASEARVYVPNRRLNLRAMDRVGKATLASNGRFYMRVDLVDDEHSGMTVHSGYSIVRSKGQLMRQMERVVRYLSAK